MVAGTTLVLGGTGKTGRRVAQRLRARNMPVRIGSRSGEPPFDWGNAATWPMALRNIDAVYISYYPDLAARGAVDAIRLFTELAVDSGVRRMVLLSLRGKVGRYVRLIAPGLIDAIARRSIARGY